jgi:VCBS repeat-containing protein
MATIGHSVASAGDVNGDGFADVIVGAANADPHGNDSGASYVVFGKLGGFAANLDLSSLDGSNGFKLSGEVANDISGVSVASAGDVNGDGFADVIVGAHYQINRVGDVIVPGPGKSYVVFGKASGFDPNIDLSSLNGSNGFKLSGVGEKDHSGNAVASAGDVNGDGFADLLIGARYASPNGFWTGATYVVFGKASGFAANLSLSSLDGSNGFRISGVASTERSGTSVASAGDVNGDGFADVIIGATGHVGKYVASYVVFGKASGFAANLNLSNLNGSNGFSISGAEFYGYSGNSVRSTGDVNGDGFADVIIGAPAIDAKGRFSKPGASYVVFGKASGFAANLNLASLNGENGFKLAGVAARDATGRSVSSAGDVNGDGFSDLIIGASGADPHGSASGVSYVVFGKGLFGAANDSFSIAENGGVAGNVFADNGHGVDTAPLGGTLAVAAVNGLAANVGLEFAVASGALVTVNANGTLAYNPNDTFDHLPAPGSGAANPTSATDSFTYTLADNTTATVTVTIAGIDSDDVISGTAGANTLFGGVGNDQVSGLGGDDALNGGVGNDILDGGGGSDTADYSGASGPVAVSLAIAGAQAVGGGLGSDTLLAIENLIGGAFADALIGNSDANALASGLGDDRLEGGAGNDRLDGRAGSDTADYSGAAGAIRVSLAISSPQAVGADQGSDTLIGIENLTGSNQADTLTGDGQINKLIGGLGADQLRGGFGDDTLYFDALDSLVDGGGGVDTGVFTGTTSGMRNYDFAAHALEKLIWTRNGNSYQLTPGSGGTRVEMVADAANSEAAFQSRTTTLDSLYRVELENRIADSGVRFFTDYDAADVQAWNTILQVFVSELGPRDYTDTRTDDGRRMILDNDQASAFSWTTRMTSFAPGAVLDVQHTLYDDGRRVVYDWDNGDLNPVWDIWESFYDAAGALTTQRITGDNGVRFLSKYDAANAQAWNTILQVFTSAGGPLDYSETRYDDGRRMIFNADEALAFNWSTRMTSFAPGAVLDFQNTLYDDGRRVIYDWDNGDLSPAWDIWENFYNTAGALTTQRITRDNGEVDIFHL